MKPGTTLGEVLKRFTGSHQHASAVLDDEGRLLGILSLYDIETALMQDLAEACRLSRFSGPLTAFQGDEATAGHGDTTPHTI